MKILTFPIYQIDSFPSGSMLSVSTTMATNRRVGIVFRDSINASRPIKSPYESKLHVGSTLERNVHIMTFNKLVGAALNTIPYIE